MFRAMSNKRDRDQRRIMTDGLKMAIKVNDNRQMTTEESRKIIQNVVWLQMRVLKITSTVDAIRMFLDN